MIYAFPHSTNMAHVRIAQWRRTTFSRMPDTTSALSISLRQLLKQERWIQRDICWDWQSSTTAGAVYRQAKCLSIWISLRGYVPRPQD